ncbi:MAG: VPLPA-CTERM sorting domain-containing protein [Desulfobulbaceae bacterium]|nr:VPLPA-CTERM sorting domain-containing protein [Desulfobulbaceae bacterium]
MKMEFKKFKHILSGVLIGLFFPIASQGAVVTSLPGLNINGTLYDATLHTTGSFNTIWDCDGDLTFGEGDSSRINKAPTFWGNSSEAQAAITAVVAALGATDWWGINTSFNPFDPSSSPYTDRVLVPYGTITVAGQLYIANRSESEESPSFDHITGQVHLAYEDYPVQAYVSFEQNTVPIPGAVWLFGSGIAGLAALHRKKKKFI